ncbi:thioredoxin [Clostridium bovifaecis]|uniref:Thioredoxin n=1 Tax=Clostridium bovifaecis TaxID=2184719 RepID=A0A6I6ESB3_9CLOT|nr:thioredoxin [Clostridium bovifaecis]
MDKLYSLGDAKKFIKQNKLVILYISTSNCSVCHALLPKIEEMLLDYPEILAKKIDVGEVTEAAGEFSIFTVPAVIFYVEGKEMIRKARFISMDELEGSVSRYYEMIKKN